MPPKAKHWGKEQDNILSDHLVWLGEVDPNNLAPNYLFDVTRAFFPNFVGEGKNG
jgi:hypothetical protein